MAINALAGALGGPNLDLVGPTVHDDIRRAIQRYGAAAVKDAVKAATKAKRGRRREPDWPELREIIEADARDWLAGGDPFAARSNYAIAKDFAERNPGHSIVSTHKRIERKLARGPYDRRWFTLVTAENISRDDFSYQSHVRAMEAVAKLPDRDTADVWKSRLARARATIADYEVREGKLPSCQMTFREVEEAVKKGGLTALMVPPKIGSYSGLPGVNSGSLGAVLLSAVEQSKD